MHSTPVTIMLGDRLQESLYNLRSLLLQHKRIDRAPHSPTTTIQNVRVYHRRPHISMTQQLLNRPQFLIGAANGHEEGLRGSADLMLSFGLATWPHMLARAMLAEQLFRATSILANHPYHREG